MSRMLVLVWTLLSASSALAQEKCCSWFVQGTVFYDINLNGVKDFGEPPLPGWTVEVLDDQQQFVSSVTTDANGFYSILCPDLNSTPTGFVREVVKPGWTQTSPGGNGLHAWAPPLDPCVGDVVGPLDFGNTIDCGGFFKTYTLDADFQQGVLDGVITNSDQLELSPTPTTFQYAWIPNTGEGTISKVDTNTGCEVARYYTGPPDDNGSYVYLRPSRTTIDDDGNCWVLNRNHVVPNNWQAAGWTGIASVTQILTSGGEDRNTNNNIDSAYDIDNDCDVDLNEILPWGDDERVVRHYLVGQGHDPNDNNPDDWKGRALALDKKGFLWVGLNQGNRVVKLDPDLPTSIYAPDQTPSHPPELVSLSIPQPYGLALSPSGFLYVSSRSKTVREIDPGLASGGTSNGPVVTANYIEYDDGDGNPELDKSYGIAVDQDCVVWVAKTELPAQSAVKGVVRWDPAVGVNNPALGWSVALPGTPGGTTGVTVDFDGNIWAVAYLNASVVKYAPTDPPTWLANYPLSISNPYGVGVANDGNIIVAGRYNNGWVKVNKNSGAEINLAGTQKAGNDPYVYTDFTGSLRSLTAQQQGFWTVITDGGSAGLKWVLVDWNDATPPSTEVTVEARVSEQINLLGPNSSIAWDTVFPPGPLPSALPGRFIETRTRLTREAECGASFVTPILYDLTVAAECDSCFVADGCEDITVSCDDLSGAVVDYFLPVLTAACDTNYVMTCDPPSGSLFPIGQTAVTCTATVGQDTLTQCDFVVTVLNDCFDVPVGACCLNEGGPMGGTCAVISHTLCDAVNGVYLGDGSSCNDDCEFLCVPPPRSMKAWWPLDDTTGNVTANLADATAVATLMGSPLSLVGEYVGNAIGFDGVDDFLEVSDAPAVNLGPYDFSIDAWVRTTHLGINSILDKRTFGPDRGYQLLLANGFPVFTMADGSGTSGYTSDGSGQAFVADGDWHLVAVTVDRSEANGGQFFVDGVPVGTFDPTDVPGNLDSSADLWIGRVQTAAGEDHYQGDLDEIEIFRRALNFEEVGLLTASGPSGKCREACYVTQRAACCDSGGENVTVSICNYDDVDHVYTWSLSPTGPTSECSGFGATEFSQNTGTVTVPAGHCVNVPVQIDCPSYLVQGQEACFQVSIYNHDTGNFFGCRGSVRLPNKWCDKWQVDAFTAGGLVGISGGGVPPMPTELSLSIHDLTGGGGALFDYELRPVVSDESASSDLVSLDGLPPGVPVFGTVPFPAGGDLVIPVSVQYTEHQPLAYDKILVLADDNQDGTREVIGELGIFSALGVPTSVEAPVRTKRPFRALPNPFNPVATIAFELATDRGGPVWMEAYDLRGRRVRTFYSGQELRPGVHSLRWPGDDDAGNTLASGVYLLRLETPSGVETVKAVLVK